MSANLVVCSLLCESQTSAVSWFARNMDRSLATYWGTAAWAFSYVQSLRRADPSDESYQISDAMNTSEFD